jgi:restriction endonuclease S subunit
MGNVALAVNDPGVPPPAGWRWVPLTRVARMESGHTPSRKNPEYWGGDIPWIGIKDAKKANGGTITETLEYTNPLGINNSSARVLPAGTVCLSRTASVGYVVKMGRDMATSQDFANWVCSDRLDPDFLRYLFIAEASALSKFSSGSVHQTIYYPELKAFHVCIPPLEEQKRIVAVLDQAFAALDFARAHAEANLADSQELGVRSVEDELSSEHLGPHVPLGDHVDLLTGFAFKSGGYSEESADIRLIRGDNIVQGMFRWDGVKRWPIADRDSYSKYELARNDVLIAMDRTWVSAGIKYAIVDEDALPSLLVQRVARLAVVTLRVTFFRFRPDLACRT